VIVISAFDCCIRLFGDVVSAEGRIANSRLHPRDHWGGLAIDVDRNGHSSLGLLAGETALPAVAAAAAAAAAAAD
jgi:hypothetical protein